MGYLKVKEASEDDRHYANGKKREKKKVVVKPVEVIHEDLFFEDLINRMNGIT